MSIQRFFIEQSSATAHFPAAKYSESDAIRQNYFN
jgi:hypothetical protein